MSDMNDSLKTRGCSELSYRITVPSTTFDIKGFAESIGTSTNSNGWRAIRRAASNSDYHIHAYWKRDSEDESKTRFQVDVHAWAPKWKDDGALPSANDFFQWAGKFFSVEKLTAHIHAAFEFSEQQWQSKIMVLPIEVPYGGKTAAIQGLSIRLHSEPEGIRDVWIEQKKKSLDLQFFGDRLLEFKTFTPYGDVEAILSVARTLIEEKKP